MNDLLLVIDMQNVYLPDQPWACETVAHTKANILKLLEKHPKNQTIFTRYIAAEHPVGTWKTYNELNRKINEDPWMNELIGWNQRSSRNVPHLRQKHIFLLSGTRHPSGCPKSRPHHPHRRCLRMLCPIHFL